MQILQRDYEPQLQPGTLAVIALGIFVFGAFPSQDDKPLAFVQGRVSIVALSLLCVLVYGIILHARSTFANIRTLLGRNFNRLILLWLGLCTLSAYLAPNPELAFLGSQWGQMGILQLSLCVGVFLVGQLVTLTEKHWKWLAYGLAVILALTFLECLGYKPLFWLPTVDGLPAATIGQRGHLAGFFATCAGASAFRKSYISLLLSGIGIALCNNTSAAIGFLILCFILIIYNKICKLNRAYIVSIIIIFLTSFLNVGLITDKGCRMLGHTKCISIKDPSSADAISFKGRLDIWEASLGMIKARPIIGWGDEQFEPRWLSFLPPDKSRKVARDFLGIPQSTQLYGDGPSYSYIDTDGKPRLGIVRNIHPHNAYLEEIQNHGILAALVISSSVLIILRRHNRLIIYLIPYSVYLIAWFYLFSVMPVFLFLLGILIRKETKGDKDA